MESPWNVISGRKCLNMLFALLARKRYPLDAKSNNGIIYEMTYTKKVARAIIHFLLLLIS